ARSAPSAIDFSGFLSPCSKTTRSTTFQNAPLDRHLHPWRKSRETLDQWWGVPPRHCPPLQDGPVPYHWFRAVTESRLARAVDSCSTSGSASMEGGDYGAVSLPDQSSLVAPTNRNRRSHPLLPAMPFLSERFRQAYG